MKPLESPGLEDAETLGFIELKGPGDCDVSDVEARFARVRLLLICLILEEWLETRLIKAVSPRLDRK